MRYVFQDWSIDVPNGWEFEEDGTCTTFTNSQGVGAFQISSYWKDQTITENDLRDFAGGDTLAPISFGDLSGFFAQFTDDETFWRKWWLKSGTQMIYATYNCPPREFGREEKVVDSMLRSLIPKDSGKIDDR